MDGIRSEPGDPRFDELLAEAASALGYSANTIRHVRDRYRQAYVENMARWHLLTDDLADLDRLPAPGAAAVLATDSDGAAAAAEAGAADGRLRTVRREVERGRGDLGRYETELSRLDLAIRNLESTWLFLERGDASLVSDSTDAMPTEIQMRIVEAQEAERSRLAQEIHDGPAQALSSAIFQVELIERVFESDPRMARAELRFLRELLRRELGDVRSFIVQLRPPMLVRLGLDGAIADTVATQAALSGLSIETDLQASADALTETAQTVVLRLVQEALQNVRRHAGAGRAFVTTAIEDASWVLEVRDDGHGFDVGAVASRGRRNFGLQFMRERAELVGAAFEVRSRPDAGTVVRLAIPLTRKETE
jgi:two-component system sensor histidine kinase DegS